MTKLTVCFVNKQSPHTHPHAPHFSPNIPSYILCLLLACNVLYINSVDMESLTGPQAIAKAISQTLASNPLPTATTVHFKVSALGITLTDSQRK